MAPKHKDLNLRPKTKAKSKAQNPQSENDFLEAADEHEQAAGKWRAGDAAKATRFFNRAIDVYNEGLKRYPGSFDLTYNKANLEYNMCEDDRIVAQLGNRIALLEETLKSHRVAMALNAENKDVLFNTGQVLASLAEAVLDAETQQVAKVPARKLLEEAVDLFTKCLSRQQQEYEQIQNDIAKAQADQGAQEQANFQQGVAASEEDMETSSATSSAPGEWATVEEPLTPETILETCVAQLDALTTLLGLYDPADLPSIEARAQQGLETAGTGIPTLIDLVKDSPFQKVKEEPAGPTLSITSSSSVPDFVTTSKDDALLSGTNFQAALAEIAYRNNQTDVAQYASAIEKLFNNLTLYPKSAEQNPAYINATSAYADALIDIASAISESAFYDPSSPSFITLLETQWSSLNQAQKLLAVLSTGGVTSFVPNPRLADIFLARGDTDLFRFRISLLEAAKPAWVNSKKVLVANAGVFYRGARSYAEKAGKEEVRKTADTKALVAEVLKEVVDRDGGVVVVKEEWKQKGEGVRRVLEQMVEEGILGRQEAEGVLRLVQ